MSTFVELILHHITKTGYELVNYRENVTSYGICYVLDTVQAELIKR